MPTQSLNTLQFPERKKVGNEAGDKVGNVEVGIGVVDGVVDGVIESVAEGEIVYGSGHKGMHLPGLLARSQHVAKIHL